MKLEHFKLGHKLEKERLEKITWGGNTASNGHVTKTKGDDCDDEHGDTDTGGSGDTLAFQ